MFALISDLQLTDIETPIFAKTKARRSRSARARTYVTTSVTYVTAGNLQTCEVLPTCTRAKDNIETIDVLFTQGLFS